MEATSILKKKVNFHQESRAIKWAEMYVVMYLYKYLLLCASRDAVTGKTGFIQALFSDCRNCTSYSKFIVHGIIDKRPD